MEKHVFIPRYYVNQSRLINARKDLLEYNVEAHFREVIGNLINDFNRGKPMVCFALSCCIECVFEKFYYDYRYSIVDITSALYAVVDEYYHSVPCIPECMLEVIDKEFFVSQWKP